MNPRLDRFTEPNASDEKSRCVWCQNKFNYQALNSDGYCPDCAPEPKEENDMTEKEMRKLDAWIAEHVMGWRRVNFCNSSTDSFAVRDEGVYIYAAPNTMVPFSPTTDPTAAMSVLEKCGAETELEECCYFGKVEDGWLIGHEQRKIESEADTLPLAICKFAKLLWEEKH